MKKEKWGLVSGLVVFVLVSIISVILSGCGAEAHNPLAIENLNGKPPKQEKLAMTLDARGIMNGVLEPDGIEVRSDYFHPVWYSDGWRLIEASGKINWHMATSSTPGSTVDFVATMSRLVFEFWDYEFYDNPGNVSFFIDGNKIGDFDLARKNSAGDKIMNYQISTQKNTVATVTMRLNSGRVVLTGFYYVALDENFLYPK